MVTARDPPRSAAGAAVCFETLQNLEANDVDERHKTFYVITSTVYIFADLFAYIIKTARAHNETCKRTMKLGCASRRIKRTLLVLSRQETHQEMR